MDKNWSPGFAATIICRKDCDEYQVDDQGCPSKSCQCKQPNDLTEPQLLTAGDDENK
jgi:hypothetical protein